jgi:hypothetical protein
MQPNKVTARVMNEEKRGKMGEWQLFSGGKPGVGREKMEKRKRGKKQDYGVSPNGSPHVITVTLALAR